MTTFLVVTCPQPACHAIYKVQRVFTPPTHSEDGVLYCPSCGRLGAVPEQMDPESTWLEVMALHYGKPLDQMDQLTKLHQLIVSQGSTMTFDEMMNPPAQTNPTSEGEPTHE